MERNSAIDHPRCSKIEHKAVFECTSRRAAGDFSLSAQRHGSLLATQFGIPTQSVGRGISSCPETSCRASEEQSEARASSSPRLISSRSDDIRSISWLRRLMHDVLSEISKRPVFATKQYVGAHEYHDSGMIASQLYHEKCRASAGLSSLLDLRLATLSFLRAKWSTDTLLRKIALDLLRAINHYRNSDVEVQLFSGLLSCKKYDGIDNKLFVQAWARLRHFPHISRTGGDRSIPAGQLWPCARFCLDTLCLAREVLAQISNRVKNAIDRWLREAPPGALGIPNTKGHPHLFSLPYSLHALQLYIGASTPAPHGAGVAPRAVENEPVTSAHVLALILLNAKMERMSPSAEKCVEARPTKKPHTLTTVVSGKQSVESKDSHSLPARSQKGSGNAQNVEEHEGGEEEEEEECWFNGVRSNSVGAAHPYFDDGTHTNESKTETLLPAQSVDLFASQTGGNDLQIELDEFGKRMDSVFELYEKSLAAHPL